MAAMPVAQLNGKFAPPADMGSCKVWGVLAATSKAAHTPEQCMHVTGFAFNTPAQLLVQWETEDAHCCSTPAGMSTFHMCPM